MTSEASSAATAKRLYDQAARLASFGAWECDLAGDVLTWTDGVYDIFGLKRGTTLHRPSTVACYGEASRAEMQKLRAETIRTGRGFMLEARLTGHDGQDRWMRLTADIAYEQSRPRRLFGSKQDITHEKRIWENLRRLAHSDPLTGLGNRRAFEAHLRESRARPRDGFVTALAIMDIDRFKAINDAFGHPAGDECLRQVSARLNRVFEDALLVARIGGDEFAVMLRVAGGRGGLVALLNRARAVLSRPVAWNHATIDLQASIGAAMLDASHREDASRLFAEADSALYLAKAAGRSRVRIFAGRVEDAGDVAALAARPVRQGAIARL